MHQSLLAGPGQVLPLLDLLRHAEQVCRLDLDLLRGLPGRGVEEVRLPRRGREVGARRRRGRSRLEPGRGAELTGLMLLLLLLLRRARGKRGE